MHDPKKVLRDEHIYFLGLPFGVGEYNAKEDVFLLTALGGAIISRKDTGFVNWTVEQSEEQ